MMTFIKRISDKVLKLLLFYFVAPFYYFIWIRSFASKQVITEEKKEVVDKNLNDEVIMDVSIKSEESEEQMDTMDLDDSMTMDSNHIGGSRCWKLSLAQLQTGKCTLDGFKQDIRQNMKSVVDFLNMQQESDYANTAHNNNNNSPIVAKSEVTVEEFEDRIINGLKIPVVVDASHKLIIVYKKKDIHET